MTVKMILATDKLGAIGVGNEIPWYCPEDLSYFKENTLDQAILMGHNTYKSLPLSSGLPKRKNLVVSNRYNGKQPNCDVTYISMQEAKRYLQNNDQNVWIIGGRSLYTELLPFAEEIHHTVIKGEYLADTYVEDTWTVSDEWYLSYSKWLSEVATVNVWKVKPKKEDGDV